MEYHKLDLGSEKLIIRDATERDLEFLVDLYRSTSHMYKIFDQPKEEVSNYLQEKFEETKEFGGGFIVSEIPTSSIIGSLLVERKVEDLDGKKYVWEYGPIAVNSVHFTKESIGLMLMLAAHEKIKKASIEENEIYPIATVTVPENEKNALEFYRTCGFGNTRKLKDTDGESVYELSKEISL